MLLQTRNLEYAYDGMAPVVFPDLSLASGQALLITGESGCGKTTLLHLMAGLLIPARGSVEINGQALNRLSPSGRDRFRGRTIGLVFQQPHFVRSLTLRENLMTAAWCAGMPTDRQRLEKLAARLDLGACLERRPDQLSAGERQRASIARAVVNRPRLLLADEPTSALDDRRCAQVLGLLQQEAGAAGAALVIVTHDARVRGQFPETITLITPVASLTSTSP